MHNRPAPLPGLLSSTPLDKKMLPQSLKELGYATHMVGKWHLGFCRWDMTPKRRGFDSFYGMYTGIADYFTHAGHWNGYDLVFNDRPVWSANGTYSPYLYTQRTIDILNTHNRSQPLFLYLAYQAVHGPLQMPEYYANNFCANITASEDRKLRCGMGAAMDEDIGNITRVLEELDYMDNLLIFFTSDNGGYIKGGSSNWPLRGSKLTFGASPPMELAHGRSLSTTSTMSKTVVLSIKKNYKMTWNKPGNPVDTVAFRAVDLNSRPLGAGAGPGANDLLE